MSHFDRLRTPLKNARGLGSAKDGVQHFMLQRMTAVALAVLSLYVVALLIGVVGSDYAGARAVVAQPLNAVLLIAFVIAMAWHAQLGLQVVIEDYVHTAWLALVAQILVRFVCVLAGLAGVLAIARLALGN